MILARTNTKISSGIDKKILETIEKTIQEYCMIEWDEKVLLALSGGKDSIFTMLALRDLGLHVIPVIVDIGYESDWDLRILKLARSHELDAHVIDVRGGNFKKLLPFITLKRLNERLDILDSIDIQRDTNVTPCTQCYNVKITAFKFYAEEHGLKTLVFGHHGTDATASFLKSALMYIDRWDEDHEEYARHYFESLVEKVMPYFLNGYKALLDSLIFRRIQVLAEQQLVGTDEPPVQYIKNSTSELKIVRPLYNIFEDMIKAYKRNYLLETEGSGCGHSATKNTQTPREMVHYRILDELVNSKDGHVIQRELLDLTKRGLAPNGTLRVNVRNERNRILGQNYKSSKSCDVKL